MPVIVDIKYGDVVSIYQKIVEVVQKSELGYLIYPQGCAALATTPEGIVIFLSKKDDPVCLAVCTIPTKAIRKRDGQVTVVKINQYIYLEPEIKQAVISLFEEISASIEMDFRLTDSLLTLWSEVPKLKELVERHKEQLFYSEDLPPTSSRNEVLPGMDSWVSCRE